MGILYIVATPIGNLNDLSFRAVEILQKVDVIACEDTRRAGLLLKHIRDRYSSSSTFRKPADFVSYYEQNEYKRIPQLITFLKNGLSVALLSDSGTPTISDPGFKLVRECIKEGIRVESIPGPSAVTSALVVSGLPTDKFLFIGFLPRKQGNRKKLLHNISLITKNVHMTIIFLEAPHRILRTLEDLKSVFGDIPIVICRELTKIYEEIRRENITQALEHFKTVPAKGEFVILFNLHI